MRTIKARALTEDHFGELVSCAKQPEPRPLVDLTRGLTFTTLWWAPSVETTVEPDDEVTIHDKDGG